MNQAHADQTKVAVQERCETNRVRLTNKNKHAQRFTCRQSGAFRLRVNKNLQ